MFDKASESIKSSITFISLKILTSLVNSHLENMLSRIGEYTLRHLINTQKRTSFTNNLDFSE